MTNLTAAETVEIETLRNLLIMLSDPHYRLKGFEITRAEGLWFIKGTIEFPCGCIAERGSCGFVPEDIVKTLHENFMESATDHGVPNLPQPKETLH